MDKSAGFTEKETAAITFRSWNEATTEGNTQRRFSGEAEEEERITFIGRSDIGEGTRIKDSSSAAQIVGYTFMAAVNAGEERSSEVISDEDMVEKKLQCLSTMLDTHFSELTFKLEKIAKGMVVLNAQQETMLKRLDKIDIAVSIGR